MKAKGLGGLTLSLEMPVQQLIQFGEAELLGLPSCFRVAETPEFNPAFIDSK